jgi:hypothetical protein
MCIFVLSIKQKGIMTQAQFNQLWEGGQTVESSVWADRPECNYSSFPEAVTAIHEEGVFCGVHFAWNDIDLFHDEHELCMFSVDMVEFGNIDIQRRKDSHGEHVYLVKMYAGEDMSKVTEVENGAEYRALPCACIIKKVNM